MTQATAETVEVDPYDEEDSNAVEIAIGIAVAEALAHPPDARSFTAIQAEEILEATVGTTLRFYSQRVLTLMIEQWTRNTPGQVYSAYEPVTAATDQAVRRAIDDTGESVRDVIRIATERARAEVARADVIEQGRDDPEAEALNRLRIGMASVSRILTTRTREEAKMSYGVAVGATGTVWRTKRDLRVRNSHGDLEGEFVRLGDTYRTVTGHKIRRPGDPRAPLSETINCRCRLSYRMPV